MTSPLTFSLDPASSGVSSSSEWLSKNQPRFPLDLLLDFGDICSISSLSFSISTDYLIPRRVEISALLKGKFETLGELAFRDDVSPFIFTISHKFRVLSTYHRQMNQ